MDVLAKVNCIIQTIHFVEKKQKLLNVKGTDPFNQTGHKYPYVKETQGSTNKDYLILKKEIIVFFLSLSL